MARKKKGASFGKVQEEILAVVPKVKLKGKVNNAFLTKVVKSLAKLDEEECDELSEDAQN